MKSQLIYSLYFLVYTSTSICAQGTWTQKADFGGGTRSSAVGFSIGTKGYVGTGGNNFTFKDFWEWDQNTDVWTQKADFGGGNRVGAVGFSIGLKGYVGTGLVSGSMKKDFWEYDPATNIWSTKADFPGGKRMNAIGLGVGNKGYVFNGVDTSGNYQTNVWEYNPTSNTWIQKASYNANYGREECFGFAINNKIYFGGGYQDQSLGDIFFTDFWEYDVAINVWTQKSNFTPENARRGAVGFSVGGKGYMGTGVKSTPYLNDFYEYDSGTNIWTTKTNFTGQQRAWAIGFSIGTKGYVGLGLDNPPQLPIVYFSDFWEFDPNGIGISEIDLENLISIYPNPTSDNLTIKSETEKITELKTYNMFGEMIYQSTNLPAHQSTIDLSSSPSGIYFLHIKTTEGVAVKKIIKQ